MVNIDEKLPQDAGTQTCRGRGFLRRLLRRKTPIIAGGVGLVSLVSSVSAETGAAGVNWTEISDLIAGAAGIMPSVGVLIAAVAGILITLMIIGFVTGIFGAIIDTLRDITRFFR